MLSILDYISTLDPNHNTNGDISMAEKISWSFLVQPLNGPIVSAAATLDKADAYDKFNIKVLDNDKQTVNLAPSGGTLYLLAINPKVPDAKLTYKLGTNDVELDGPHVLIGSGAVGLLGGVTSLDIDNKTGADAEIEILIARDSTS